MIILTNKKAYFEYQILEKYTCGIRLLGYETKALREGKGRLEGSYINKIDSKLQVINFYIGRYSKISQKIEDSELSRSRELLLNKKEISKILSEISQKGKSCVPLNLRMEHGLFKLEIAVVKGKKEYEKKVVTKERQLKRELERDKKQAGTWA